MLPLSFVAGQSLLTAIPPAPGPQRSSLSPGAGRISPVLPGFARPAFILSAPGLAWASPQAITRLQLRGRLGVPATPARYGRTEPPGRHSFLRQDPTARV